MVHTAVLSFTYPLTRSSRQPKTSKQDPYFLYTYLQVLLKQFTDGIPPAIEPNRTEFRTWLDCEHSLLLSYILDRTEEGGTARSLDEYFNFRTLDFCKPGEKRREKIIFVGLALYLGLPGLTYSNQAGSENT